ncbi:MAG: hypothetical protein QOH10_596 [Actinomycetota bacterium]|nr:hypothetical protein [Actinomycetota bacterium]
MRRDAHTAYSARIRLSPGSLNRFRNIGQLFVAGALGLGLAGCTTGQTRSAPGPTDPPPTTRSSPSSPPTVEAAGDTTAPPPIRATGRDYAAIARSLTTYRDWLLVHHPEPALAGEVYQRGTVSYQEFVSQLTTLRANHQTTVSIDQRLTFTPASVHGSLMTLRGHETIVEDRILDRDHHVVSTHVFPAPNDFVMVMTSDATGRWRIADVTRVALHPTIVLSP